MPSSEQWQSAAKNCKDVSIKIRAGCLSVSGLSGSVMHGDRGYSREFCALLLLLLVLSFPFSSSSLNKLRHCRYSELLARNPDLTKKAIIIVVIIVIYGSLRKLGVPYFGVLYNKDPTI